MKKAIRVIVSAIFMAALLSVPVCAGALTQTNPDGTVYHADNGYDSTTVWASTSIDGGSGHTSVSVYVTGYFYDVYTQKSVTSSAGNGGLLSTEKDIGPLYDCIAVGVSSHHTIGGWSINL